MNDKMIKMHSVFFLKALACVFHFYQPVLGAPSAQQSYRKRWHLFVIFFF